MNRALRTLVAGSVLAVQALCMQIAEGAGDLHVEKISLIATSLSEHPFSPASMDGRRDFLSLEATFGIRLTDALRAVEQSSDTADDKRYFVEWEWTVLTQDGSSPLVTLQRLEELRPPFQTLLLPQEDGSFEKSVVLRSSQMWNGRDEKGALVSDGLHVFALNARIVWVDSLGPDSASTGSPREVDELTLTRTGQGVVLQWERVTTDLLGNPLEASGYNLYRGTLADFVPDIAGHSNRLLSVVGTQAIDRAADASSHTYFYLVAAVDGQGNESGAGIQRRTIDAIPATGGQLSIDNTPPEVQVAFPADGSLLLSKELTVSGLATDAFSGLDSVVVNGVVAEISGNDWSVPISLATNLVHVEAFDRAGNSTVRELEVRFQPGVPFLDAYPSATNHPEVALSGGAVGSEMVEVSGPEGVLIVDVVDGRFTVVVPLRQNSLNKVFFTGLAGGLRGAPATAAITHDAQPPELFIDFPQEEAQIADSTTDVAGRVGDVLSGFMSLSVIVNGIPAAIDVGVGTNGTFLARNVPLGSEAATEIIAVATDLLGNSRTRKVTVQHVELPPDAPRMSIVSGSGQSGRVMELLESPVVVRVTHPDGTPFSDKVVTFHVVRSDGRLTPDGLGEGALTFQAHTDDQGEARAFWRMGSDAGCGNNRIEVTSNGIAGTSFACASASPGPAAQINVGAGNNQRGEVNSPLPDPVIAWVNDGCNGVSGVPVTFRVRQGGGTINGGPEAVVVTGETGHAAATLTLGSQPGNNLIVADFAGNQNAPATFLAVAVGRGDARPTSFSAMVVDNSARPIGGAECHLTVNGEPLPAETTDESGVCAFSDIPAGPAHVVIDGLPATSAGDQDVPPESFPGLGYDVTIVPGAANALPAPVRLPMLNPNNAVLFDNSADVELTVEGIEGLKMLVRSGSMTLADGSVPSPEEPAILALNQVHADEIPMPMPDGASPLFAWTLQPAGARFDPPIQVEYPNLSGLPAGSTAYFLSFNHDTNRFEIVASGRVTDDGLSIHSDPGAGISVSGWGGNCPPYSVTGEAENEDECSCGAVVNGAREATLTAIAVVFNALPGTGTYAGDHLRHFLSGDGSGRSYGQGSGPVTDISAHPAFLARHSMVVADLTRRVGEAVAAGRTVSDYSSTVGSMSFYPPCTGASPCTQIAAGIGGVGPSSASIRSVTVMGGTFSASVTYTITDQYVFDNEDAEFGGPDLMAFCLQSCGEATPFQNRFEFMLNVAGAVIEPLSGPGSVETPAVEAAEEPDLPPFLGGGIDGSFTLSAANQSVMAEADGTFRIPNISAADRFGTGGPGTPRDFLSDDFLRIVGVGTGESGPRWVFTEPFQIRQGVPFSVSTVTFTDTPPPLPVSLRLGPAQGESSTLEVGGTTQLRSLALLGDGSTQDVTPRTSWTTYRTSNPAIASVGHDGLVTGHALGPVVVTAINEGVSAVARITVTAEVLLTSVEGFVQGPDGSPVEGAVARVATGEQAISGPDGFFRIADLQVASEQPRISILVSAVVGGLVMIGRADDLEVRPGGITDAGIIVLAPSFANGNGGFETGDFAGYSVNGNAAVVQNLGFVLPPEGVFMASISTDPVGTVGQLISDPFPVTADRSRIGLKLNFLTDELDQGAAFNDTFVLRVIIGSGPPIELLRITRDDLRGGVYPVVTAPPGFDGMTGFLSPVIDLSAYVGGMMQLELCFLVRDLGDSGVRSTVLIDDIHFIGGP